MCKRGTSGGLCKIWVSCTKNTQFKPLCVKQDTGNFTFSQISSKQGDYYEKRVTAQISRIDLDLINELESLGACCGVLVKIKTMNGQEWVLNDVDTPFELRFSGQSGTRTTDPNFVSVVFSGETKKFIYG